MIDSFPFVFAQRSVHSQRPLVNGVNGAIIVVVVSIIALYGRIVYRFFQLFPIFVKTFIQILVADAMTFVIVFVGVGVDSLTLVGDGLING